MSFRPSRFRQPRSAYLNISARVTPEVKDALDRISAERNVSLNGVINDALGRLIESAASARLASEVQSS